MRELQTSRPRAIAVQLGAVWMVGAVALPTLWSALLIAAFAPANLFGVAALGCVLAGLAYLIVVITITRGVSVLGATGGGRVLWAVLVLGGGTVGWAVGWAITDIAKLDVGSNPLLTFLLGGVPFALAAGVLLRGWRFSAVAGGLSVVLVGAGVVVLERPPGDLDARLAANAISRETSWAVTIPGYLPQEVDYGNGVGGSRFRPADPDVVPLDRYITIIAHNELGSSEQMCGQRNAQDSNLTWGSCVIEAGGLVYRHNTLVHGYQVSIGQHHVTVVGTPGVDHGLLRTAAQSLHLASTDELGDAQEQTGDFYAVTVPGYIGRAMENPRGMTYEPDQNANGALSVSITLSVTHAEGEEICFRTTECTPDGTGLTYLRDTDSHGYVLRRDEMNVRVAGGLLVDKALLRQATMDARPATDEELRRALPPKPPRSLFDSLFDQ